VQRYLCRGCGKHFSAATGTDTFRQKKRRINRDVRWLLAMKVNQRALAAYLGVNRKTIVHRLLFFAQRGRAHLDTQGVTGLDHIVIDELQSSVHTKCKPVAIPMAVCAKSRRILAVGVAAMPAQHPLKEIAWARYGPRADDRPAAFAVVLERIAPMLKPGGQVSTDCALHYPEPIARLVPHAVHLAFRSRKARVTGQGELKKIGFDPLFALNHTAAMVRDRTSRLVRKTWANTKRLDRLEAHLLVYAHFHNEIALAGKASAK
jgi:hypothetical protein